MYLILILSLLRNFMKLLLKVLLMILIKLLDIKIVLRNSLEECWCFIVYRISEGIKVYDPYNKLSISETEQKLS